MSVDVAETLDAALPVYLTLVVGLALVLLVLVFRSLLVPLVGVLGLLTLGASLGATVAVFSWGWLSALVDLDEKSIAFALAVGILVDAFVVRMVIVPAALSLLGERAWWLPRWLRWLPALDVEGEGLRTPAAVGAVAPQPEPATSR